MTTQAEQDAMNSIVRGIVERAIASLMVIGMTHEAALTLLMVQSAIRMDDAAQVREVIASIEDELVDDDDDDDRHCAVSKRKGSGLD